MELIEPEGRRFIGADAIPEIASRLPGWKLLTPILRCMLAFRLLHAPYDWIARNRGRLKGGSGRCSLPAD